MACDCYMSAKDKIDIEELRKAINLLLDHLLKSGIREIELKEDSYREIFAGKLYDVITEFNEKSDLSIGSLFDDWKSTQEIADGKSEPLALLLLKIAPLLQYIGNSAEGRLCDIRGHK